MAQFSKFWLDVAEHCVGKEWDTLQSLLAEEMNSKSVNAGKV